MALGVRVALRVGKGIGNHLTLVRLLVAGLEVGRKVIKETSSGSVVVARVGRLVKERRAERSGIELLLVVVCIALRTSHLALAHVVLQVAVQTSADGRVKLDGRDSTRHLSLVTLPNHPSLDALQLLLSRRSAGSVL